MLEIAAILCFFIGIIHSYLGERYILIRLFRADRVPHLFGGDYFTKRTLRFSWHITTFAWWGFGYLLMVIATGEENLSKSVLLTISAVFFFSGIFSFGFTRGKHISWVVFGQLQDCLTMLQVTLSNKPVNPAPECPASAGCFVTPVPRYGQPRKRAFQG